MPPSTTMLASGGLRLATREHSPAGPGRPTVVLVHGYPDRQEVWDPLIAELPRDWHVVTYDVRGAGRSEAPDQRDGYRTERLVDDLVAVLDAVLPDGEQAHLVGHDWGSVQLWDAVAAEASDPRLRGRIASFTSVSGPSLDHLALLSRRRDGRRVALARQALRSWYVDAFHVPLLPELVWRRGHGLIGPALAERQGLPRDHWGPGLGDDAAHGLELYRANVLRRMRHPTPFVTDVPVLVVHPTRDPFLGEVVLQDLDQRCRDLRVERVDAGHWVVVTRAARIAALVREHVGAHRSGPDRNSP